MDWNNVNNLKETRLYFKIGSVLKIWEDVDPLWRKFYQDIKTQVALIGQDFHSCYEIQQVHRFKDGLQAEEIFRDMKVRAVLPREQVK